MKTPTLPFFFLPVFLLVSVVSAEPLPTFLHIDSMGNPWPFIHQAADCTITEVRAYESEVVVSFTGRWNRADGFRPLSDGFIDPRRNTFVIRRTHSNSQATWDFLVRRFTEHRNKPSTITLTGGGWISRGGILYFEFPRDKIAITTIPTLFGKVVLTP